VVWLFRTGTAAPHPFGGALLVADGELPAVGGAKQLQHVANHIQHVLSRERADSTSS
jgi:hypothetical protein